MRIRSSDFVPADLLPQGRQYSLVVESLHFQDIMLGYIVFETGPEEGSIYVSLRDQLSSALYGAVLLSERSQVKGLLEKTLATMRGKAEVVSAQSRKINTNVTGVSSSMEEMAASIREISAHIKTVMENVNGAESLANTASSDIGRLTESTSKIAAVVGLINDIAEMTNVLALNAAIEAAHAGASGRGFSVVAKEVKKLAAQTVASTAEIQNIVNKNVEGAEQTSQAIAKTREAIRKISELASSITAAISEQAQASSEVSSLLIDASQGTAEISRAISEIARLG
jgi:methyl-accepting chemotaxis protein